MTHNLTKILSQGWSIPESITVSEWGSKYLRIPSSPFGSTYRPEMSAYLADPLEAITNDSIREIVLACSAQSSKSTYLYLALAYLLSEHPAPTLFIAPTEAMSLRYARQRIMPILNACPKLQAILPNDKEHKQLRELTLPQGSLMIGPANEQFCQSWSVKYVLCDEVARFKNDGILEQIRARTTMYHDSTTILASTFEDEGDDFHRAWERTQQHVFHLRCPKCDGLIQPEFGDIIKWPNDAIKKGESYDYEKLKEVVYMECPHCKAQLTNDDQTWRSMVSNGCYPQKPTSELVGYRWNSLSLPPHIMSWATLATEFLQGKEEVSRGYYGGLKEWVRLRCALPWSDKKVAAPPSIKLEPYKANVKWDRAKYTFIGADIGGSDCDKNWVCVRSFAENGDSRLIDYQMVDSFEAIDAIRKKYDVPPHLLICDSGYSSYNVYQAAAKYGWCVAKGEELKNDSGYRHNVRGKHVYRPYSKPVRVDIKDGTNRKVVLFKHSNLLLKDLLHLSRTGKTQAKWQVADVGPYTSFYLNQLDNEVKQPVVQKRTGKPILRWVRTGANEAVDTECLCLLLATMANLPVGKKKG